MKKNLIMMICLGAMTLFSCNNAGSGNDSANSATDNTNNSTETTANGMKKYEDSHLSFEYPSDWEVKTINIESNFNNATAYRLLNSIGEEIFNFSIDEPFAFTLGKASLEEFLEYNNPDNYEVLRQETFTTQSGETGFYFEFGRSDEYTHQTNILLPTGSEVKGYEINGMLPVKDGVYRAHIQTEDLLSVLKSLNIKAK